ncbi:hypothetical protein O181_005672 [Austropuccinia psidii MF-1]|uniref:Uncharacterized protein n=1 Tax=Austropuccinia psidii MF-1 TaxID=1389203 RepID=A0A9Q3GGW4_9BASI|nr:hypothetical protein [Austropuccinia psidii MF-1]
MVITKGWNPTRKFRLLEDRATRMRENQANIQAIEEQLTQTGHTQIHSGSQRSRPNQLSSSFTQFRNQQISGQESPFFTIPGFFQEKTKIQGQKQDLFQPKEERVRPDDPEAVGLGERRTKEPEIVVHTSRISSPINRNITPTQTEHIFFTPESNLNSDKMWLQMSQFSVQTQESLDDFKRLNERLKRNAILQKATIEAIQESCAQLSKASEETNKRLNQVFEEKNNCKRDRDFLDQDLNFFLMSTKT